MVCTRHRPTTPRTYCSTGAEGNEAPTWPRPSRRVKSPGGERMPDALLEPRDPPRRTRAGVLLLLAAVLLCAAVGQAHFAIARSALETSDEAFAHHRDLGVLWYALS